jgi:O-antigen/teichoic acid export membrane protein
MSTRRALSFSFLDRYASLALSIGSSMFISRLLTPAEIGVFSVTMVLLIMVTSLRDLGAGQYLIQEKDLTPERLRAAWAVSLGTGLFAAFVVVAAAKPAAIFYNEPRMVGVMLVIALNFALNPFGSLTYAWLMREMRFDALALMRFLSGLAGACTSVYLAWRHWGPISLAIGSLASTVVNGLVASRFRPRHFPLRPSFSGARRVVATGSKFSANGLLGALGGSAAELLLGKLQSLANAALYSRANGLGSMFQRLVLDATQVVAIPMFARESRDQGDISNSFIRTVSYVTALGWSFFLGLALLAYPAIRLLYGSQWDAAVSATRIIALAYMAGIPAAMCPAALMGIGAPGAMLRITVITSLAQIAAMAIGARISLDGAAVALLLSYSVGAVLWLGTTRRQLGFAWPMLFVALGKSAVVALITAIAPASALWWFGWNSPQRVAPLLLSTIGGLALFVAAVWLSRHPLRAELERLLNQLFARRRAAAMAAPGPHA